MEEDIKKLFKSILRELIFFESIPSIILCGLLLLLTLGGIIPKDKLGNATIVAVTIIFSVAYTIGIIGDLGRN